MATLTIPSSTTMPSGELIAVGISAEDYLAQYADSFHEWVRGVVIKMSPVSGQHDLLTAYLRHLLDAYFALRPIGQVRAAPFVMQLKPIASMREPDLQVILKGNLGRLTDTAMIGPADLCIEVVSPESVARDYGNKFEEYEKAGVHEYWIIDPIRQRCQFNRLQGGVYVPVVTDDAGYYVTPLLPKLALHVPTLWLSELPTVIEIVQTVQVMVK